MNNNIDLQKYRSKRTEEELEKFEQRLQKHRDHLYLGLKNLNKGEKEYEQRIRYLERHENYFRNQERRLLLVAIIALTLLLLWFLYLWFNGAELGEAIWIVSVGVLGILLITILVIYFLDKNGLKEQSEKIITRALFHLVMSPLYLFRILHFAIRKMFKQLRKKLKINKY